MSFADILRQSRSSPTAVLHQFLTTYDPNDAARVYAFVEGDPDKSFYRSLIERYLDRDRKLLIHNCEGKRNVYDIFLKVTARHPRCRNIVFFVDKDLDELVGRTWPTDPRIFVTDAYSIENYVVAKAAVERYFADFVKLRKISFELEPAIAQFDSALREFHRAVTPLMAWIVVVRRTGINLRLTDVDMAELFEYGNHGVVRTRPVNAIHYLERVTGSSALPLCWRQVRRVSRELGLQGDPKRFVRGKFEAWFLIEFVRRLVRELQALAGEAGGSTSGSVAVTVELHGKNFIQLLVRGIEIPPSLNSFLNFHFGTPSPVPAANSESGGWWERVHSAAARFLRRRHR